MVKVRPIMRLYLIMTIACQSLMFKAQVDLNSLYLKSMPRKQLGDICDIASIIPNIPYFSVYKRPFLPLRDPLT